MEMIFRLVSSLISLYLTLLMIRAVVSWIPTQNGSSVYSALVRITEPLVAPFRALVDRFPQLRNSFIDVPVLLSFIFFYIMMNILRRGI